MIDTVVIATDGSDSVSRAVDVALDVAGRFDAEVHALYVLEESEFDSAPEKVRTDLRDALAEQGQTAVGDVRDAGGSDVITEIRTGRPATEIARYARDVDADLVATGTRGRHGENRFRIGSVAERVVRTCPVPVLTVRQLQKTES